MTSDDRPTCERCGRRFTRIWDDVQCSPDWCPACVFAGDDEDDETR